MAYITAIYGYYSPGFTEESPVRLAIGSSLSTGSANWSLTSQTIRPSVDRLFSEIKLPTGDYYNIRNTSYIRVTFDMNSGSDLILYGFVDSVELSSDSSSYPMVTIKWHVDPWETYKGSVSLGYGHISRRASGDHPLQGYSNVRRYLSSSQNIVSPVTYSSFDVWWVIIARTVSSGGYTTMEYDTFPVTRQYQHYGISTVSGSTAVLFPDMDDALSGSWDEYLGISPNTITGCWLSPIPPFSPDYLSGSGTSSDPWYITAGNVGTFETSTKGYFKLSPFFYASKSGSLSSSVTTTERSPAVACGLDGEPLLEFPVGVTLSSYAYRTVLSATTCSIEIRFNGIASHPDGLCVTVPCTAIDMTENAWSEYVYSGQRQYDIDARNLASDKAEVSSALSGVQQSIVFGGFSKGGAGLAAIAGIAGAVAQGATEIGYFNPQAQALTDRATKKQSAGILISGGAYDHIWNGQTVTLAVMAYDSVSETLAANSDTYHGYATDLFTASVSLYIYSGVTGFWQADGVNVSGSAPAEAKRYISNLLSRGVYLT